MKSRITKLGEIRETTGEEKKLKVSSTHDFCSHFLGACCGCCGCCGFVCEYGIGAHVRGDVLFCAGVVVWLLDEAGT